MYDVEKTVSLPVTASAQPGNLSRLAQGDQVYTTVIHRQEVDIVNLTNPSPQPIRVFPQLGSRPFSVTEARWVRTLSGRHVLVLTGYGGVLLYDWDGSLLLKVVPLQDEAAPGSSLFARGVTELVGNVAVGCSTGEIIILSSGDGCIEVDGELTCTSDDSDVGTELARIKWRSHGVSALTSTSTRLAVGDDRGNITIGQIVGVSAERSWDIESYGSSVTCLKALGNLLVAGYISGHVRIYNLDKEVILVEICGHARAVTGIDVVRGASDGEALRAVTVGEDTFVRVWTVHTDSEEKVKHVHGRSISNQLLTGVAFTDDVGNGYVTAAYDVPHMLCYLST